MYAHTAAGEGIGPIADATRAGPGLGASPTGPGAPPAPDTTSPMRIDLSMSMNLPYGPYSTAPSLAGPPQLTAQLPMAPPQLPYPNPHHHQPPPLPRGLAYPAVYPPSHSASGAGVESSEALSLPKVAASECPSAFLPPPALHHMPRPGPLPLGHHPAFLPHHYDPGHHGPAVELPVERGPVDHYHHLHFLDQAHPALHQADRGASYVSSLAGPCVGQGEAELRFRGHPLSSAQLHSSGLHAPSLHGPPLQTPTLEPSAPPPPHRMLIDQSLHHQLSLQPPMPPVEPSKPKARGRKSSAVRKHQCPECLKQYCRRSTLKAHLRFHKGERPFRCPDCAKTFSQAANLTAHRRVHTGEKPFSCPVCRRPFSQSSSLVTHKRTHTGERPYQCRDCGKAFTDSSTLTKHLRTHSGAKPYECQLCSLTFSQSGNLNRHMKTHFNPPPPIDHDSLLPPHLS